MANPWLKKNPLMSMWLSSANRVAGSMRGQVAAEVKRQAALANQKKTTVDAVKFWSGGMHTEVPSAPVKRRKRR